MNSLKWLSVVGLVFAACSGFVAPAWAGVNKKVILAPQWDQGQAVRVALLPMEAKTSQEEGARNVRRALYGQLLSNPEFRLIEPAAVDMLLQEEGLLEKAAWKKADPEKLGQLLGVDYLLFPKLTGWSQRYMLLQSQTSVGIRARMVDVHTGEDVWEAECKAKFGKGLTGIPTGGAALALEPLRGMSKQHLFDCAYEAAVGLFECLQPVEPEETTRRSKPGVVNSGRPTSRARKSVSEPQTTASPPTIRSASMAFENRVLTVEMEGTEGCSGSFLGGETNCLFPLSEISPGLYRGQYRIPAGASFSPSDVEVRLVRPDGQAVIGQVQ
ncbi:MAG: GNA1162 family protein [bacterium]